MFKIRITTSKNVTYNYIHSGNFPLIENYIAMVCNAELCPKSAIKKITIERIEK